MPRSMPNPMENRRCREVVSREFLTSTSLLINHIITKELRIFIASSTRHRVNLKTALNNRIVYPVGSNPADRTFFHHSNFRI